MKKIICLALLLPFSYVYANQNIDKIKLNNPLLQKIYNITFSKIEKNLDNLDNKNLEQIKNEIRVINNNFRFLEDSIKIKDRKNGKDQIDNIKKGIKEIEKIKEDYFDRFPGQAREGQKGVEGQKEILEISNELQKIEILKIPSKNNGKYGELMYYADSFEGKHTSNGNIFSQKYFSAAKCSVPLDTLTQVILNGKSIIIKVNDRPSCSRFPDLIDMTTTSFDYMHRRYVGKQKGEYIELGEVSKDYYKMYISEDFFSKSGIKIGSKIPNSLLINETFHIYGEVKKTSFLTLQVISPSGKKLDFKKTDSSSDFAFSIPFEEVGAYKIKFISDLGESQSFDVNVFSRNFLDNKKYFEDNSLNLLNKLFIKKELQEEQKDRLRFVIGGNNFNTIRFSQNEIIKEFSGVGDVVIYKDLLSYFDLDKEINIEIITQKTLTNFSQDSYSFPVLVFKGKLKF